MSSARMSSARTGARATLSGVGTAISGGLGEPAGSATVGGLGRPLRPRAGDLGLAAVAMIVAVGGTVVELLGAPVAGPPLAGGVAIAAGAALLVAWRRHATAATAGVLALCLLYHALSYPGLAPAVVLFVTVYAMTADGAGARSLAATALVIVVVSVIPLLPPQPRGFGWAEAGSGIGLVAVAALGEATRTRRLALEERLRAAAQDTQRRLVEDRIEIAREVHDVLAHTITVIAVQAAAATEALPGRPDDALTALTAVRGAARDALTELRGTLAVLRTGPDTLHPESGLAQLPQLQHRATQAGLAVTLTITANPEQVPAPVGRAIYRIVQEALTNTLRHAAATTATVTIEPATITPPTLTQPTLTQRGRPAPAAPREGITVEILDDGAPTTYPSRPGGHGLLGMAERARALGGTFDAGPAPGHGFRVVAHIPTTTTITAPS